MHLYLYFFFRNDKIHLHKMKTDCESMKRELESLKGEIKKEMEQKFGQQVSLVSLYEAVLRRLIYDIKANTSSLIKFYDEKIKSKKILYLLIAYCVPKEKNRFLLPAYEQMSL